MKANKKLSKVFIDFDTVETPEDIQAENWREFECSFHSTTGFDTRFLLPEVPFTCWTCTDEGNYPWEVFFDKDDNFLSAYPFDREHAQLFCEEYRLEIYF